MRHNQSHLISLFFFSFMLSCSMAAQSWDFIKEKDGIKIYTRTEAGRSLKSYRGITEINAPAEKIFALMEDTNNKEWWDKKLTQIKILHNEMNKRTQYYMVYNLPWPVKDRDLCVDVKFTTDTLTGEHTITAVALNGVIPEHNDMVRIKDYLQTWILIPAGNDLTHVSLEGYVDPAGNIPDWISNFLIIESPIKAISGLRDAISKK